MRILIAEGDAVSRALLTRAVEGLRHTAVTVESGAQAWSVYREQGADVIISDFAMPEMDGIELCRHVRSETGRAYTYFVLLTASTEKARRLRAMQAGADDYLTKPLDADELRLRLIAAQRVGTAYRKLVEQQDKIQRINRALYEDGRRDPLTGVGNRSRMEEDLEALRSRLERYGRVFSVALFDLDRFRQYNDTCGHLAGDEALTVVARCLADRCRAADAVFRYGGEEFLVVFPEQGVDEAAGAAERMRAAVERRQIPHPGQPSATVLTVSAGVTTCDATPERTFAGVLTRADRALAAAKAGGRNLVAVDHEV